MSSEYIVGIDMGSTKVAVLIGEFGLSRELRIAGEALSESASDLVLLRRLHEHTVDSLNSGLLTTDLDSRVRSLNPEAERIIGLAPSEVLGRDLEEVLPGVREALLVGKETKMPDLLVMVTTLGGLALFGAAGLLVGPIIGALFMTVWRLWGSAFEEARGVGNAVAATDRGAG